MEVASPHLERLGGYTRPAGSAGAAEGRAYCAATLARAGFAVTEHEFHYSNVAGGWAMPIAGVVASLTGIGIYLGRLMPRVGVLSAAVLALALLGLAYLGRGGVLDFPALRRKGVNLRAVRGSERPRVWLVAHIDSKWQPISMFARVAGVIGASLGLVALALVTVLHPRVREIVPAALLMLTWLGSVPMMLSIVGNKNHGTLDNASGVAAVLQAAEEIDPMMRVGVLITDAEELGLAGSRHWARDHVPSIALNCDSVDDDGRLTVMYTGTAPTRLLTLVADAATAEGEPLRSHRLIPGILTDSVALAAAGWETVTLSRGNARTLGRIHTSRDTLAHMRGTGIAGMARVLARTATELG